MSAEHALEKLGLKDNEIKVYLQLAGSGKATATILSKKTSIPRTTVYTTLEHLIERGLVSIEHASAVTNYLVNDVSAFERMVEDEQEKIKSKFDLVKELPNVLLPFFTSSLPTAPKLQYFEGKRNIENMLFQYLPVWRKSYERAGDFTTWGFVDHSLHKEYKRWTLHRLSLMGINPDERVCLFSNQPAIEEQERMQVPGREVRVLPDNIIISSSVLLYGDFIIMIKSRGTPHYAFQLQSAEFSQNLRAVFKMLWAMTTGSKQTKNTVGRR